MLMYKYVLYNISQLIPVSEPEVRMILLSGSLFLQTQIVLVQRERRLRSQDHILQRHVVQNPSLDCVRT